LEVGPDSAGAEPGPACYDAGGPLTLTDVNLLLGRLDPARFAIPVDPAAADACLETLLETLARERGTRPDADAVLAGLLAIGDERMASAIARVSERRGHDPAECALVAFGGAGPQHACAVAERLGIDTVVVPAEAALLSAAGLGETRIERIEQSQVLARLDDVEPELPARFATLAERGIAAVAAEGVDGTPQVVRRLATLRRVGQQDGLDVEADAIAGLRDAFQRAYEQRFGHTVGDAAVEVESIRVIVAAVVLGVGDPPEPEPEPGPDATPGSSRTASAATHADAWFGGQRRRVPVYERGAVPVDRPVRGPCLIVEPRSVFVLPPGWVSRSHRSGTLIASRDRETPAASDRTATPAVAAEELFAHRLGALAAEAGDRLQRTALSTNVKERLDFSCAILDADGTLIVNAPHIPVHLGALGQCVRAVVAATPLAPGDVVLTNHPGFGGSHLPDLTVVTPIDQDGVRLGYAACRAHHADVGSARPGSMPPDATNLAAEGVVIAPTLLVRGGVDRLEAFASWLRATPEPPRMIAENMADLRAQIASNQHAALGVCRLAAELGAGVVATHMRSITGRAERLLRHAIARRPDGVRESRATLDDGTPLRVRVEIDGERLRIDFAGSGGRHPGNLNAPAAVVSSAVMYVARLLAGADLPLNEGLLRAIDLGIPPGFLNPTFSGNPARDPAVVGGNVETSQRVVEVLVDALGLA
ncbi:MAG: hydantoinase B/oxoprolinase family protein, partial [Phycisphaerae bacterium]|nr:hydantoinase B/oxoprolinase family protein [Phycisphaerae bacterium]